MINGKLIKVCGMRNAENIQQVENIREVDMLGFICYPKSPRYIETPPSYLPTRARRVGVFVDEEKQTVLMHAERFGLDYIQLHGSESPEYCESLRMTGFKVIKVFSVACPADLESIHAYEDSCDLFLFDTRCEQHGGSGKQFDWSILHAYTGKRPFLLSGGIHADSSHALNDFKHPLLAGYDLNSRFEVRPGEKNPDLLQAFLNELK